MRAVIEILAHRLLDCFFCWWSCLWPTQLFSPQSLSVVIRFLFEFLFFPVDFIFLSFFFFPFGLTRSGRAQTRLSFTVWMLLGRKHFFFFFFCWSEMLPEPFCLCISYENEDTLTHNRNSNSHIQTHTHTHAVDQRNKSLITSTERVFMLFCLIVYELLL